MSAFTLAGKVFKSLKIPTKEVANSAHRGILGKLFNPPTTRALNIRGAVSPWSGNKYRIRPEKVFGEQISLFANNGSVRLKTPSGLRTVNKVPVRPSQRTTKLYTGTPKQLSLFRDDMSPINSAIRNNTSLETKKEINKWIPTIVGAGIIGGGLVAYSESRKNGRRNNELFRP